MTTEELFNKIKIDDIDTITPYTKNKKTINMSLGRQFFNSLLPDDYPIVNELITSAKLKEIIKDILEKYGPDKTTDIISNIQYYCFKITAIIPSTFTIDGLIPTPEWQKKKEEFQKNPPSDLTEYKNKVKQLAEESISNTKLENSPIQYYLDSKAKGNPAGDWASIMVSKGHVLDVEDKLLGPIIHSINDGYDPIEYYQGASESRRGFYYKTTAVQDPGYMSRKLAMANAKISIDKEIKDCKTKKYMLFVITKNNHHLLNNRYLYPNQKISNTEELIGQTVKIRSPLFCKSENGICPICYGDGYKLMKTSNIGILASGAVNSVCINAFMKMRHQSSQVDIVNVDFNELINNSKIDLTLVKYGLIIEKNKIIAKEPLFIIIDRNDYDDKSLIDSGTFFMIPGMIDINFGDLYEFNTLSMPFNFKINLIKPENMNVESSQIFLYYNPGEIIIEQDNYLKEVDPTIISKLFEAQAKYITDPEMLLNALHQQLPNVDLVHLETIIQNMFRSNENPAVFGRLVDYKNVTIYSQKKLPFINSWLNSMAFENINKAISTGLLNNKSIQFDPYEKLILEKFERTESSNT